jgi:RNA polymerase sigma factor (sigma-70 family)
MSQTLERTDQELVAGCLSGDKEDWTLLVTRYKRLVYSIPFRAGLRGEDCNEVFQSVWLDCYRHLGSLRDTQCFEAWLIRIAVRRSWQLKKLQRTGEAVPLPAGPAISGDEFAERLLNEQMIQTAVSRLTGRCQQVIRGLFFEDPQPSYAELAQRLGLSPNSIGYTRDRCLDCLGKVLRELGYR